MGEELSIGRSQQRNCGRDAAAGVVGASLDIVGNAVPVAIVGHAVGQSDVMEAYIHRAAPFLGLIGLDGVVAQVRQSGSPAPFVVQVR